MAYRRRVQRLFLVVGALFGVVWLRVAHLQILDRATWEAEARALRLRRVPLAAPRGRIVDARGEVLARDVAVFQVHFVGYEWLRRARARCTACGTVHFHRVGRRPPRLCRCGHADARLVPLPLGDPGPVEEALGLEPGTLQLAAADRVGEVRDLRDAYEDRLVGEERAPFAIGDEVRLYYEDLLLRPYVIVSHVPDESREAVRLLELDEEGRYRGFRVGTELRREHPQGDLAPQLLGFVSYVRDPAELAAYRRVYGDNVTLDTRVGRRGIEAAHDALLVGLRGWQRRERDEDGAFTRVVDERPPQTGMELRLAVTVSACREAEAVLERYATRESYYPRALPSGGFVAMDAETGAIVAWGETPRFDLDQDLERLFDASQQEAVFDPDLGAWRPPPGRDLPPGQEGAVWQEGLSKPVPLGLSRVAEVAVEPGSSLKPFIGLGLLAAGRPLPYDEPGPLLPCGSLAIQPGCHRHGPVGFESGLGVSCNRYFALVLRDSPHWPRNRVVVGSVLDRLGFGHPTGVDVAGEARGRWLHDWVDFDPRAVAQEVVERLAPEARARGQTLVLDLPPGVPGRVAGRGPARLRSTLEAAVTWGLAAAPAGRVALRLLPLGRQDRWIHLRAEVHAFPSGDAPAAPPRASTEDLARRVARLHARLEPVGTAGERPAVGFVLAYHEPIGRQAGEPPVIRADDGRNVAIGQGPVNVTPLQMVRAVAALANGGRLVTPHLAAYAGGRPLRWPSRSLDLDPAWVERVRRGMRHAVSGSGGTAARPRFGSWRSVNATVYGKTGTAQVGGWWRPYPAVNDGPWHHWFVGFAEAPGRSPLAFACVLHSRTEGAASLTAVEAVRDFLEWWFER